MAETHAETNIIEKKDRRKEYRRNRDNRYEDPRNRDRRTLSVIYISILLMDGLSFRQPSFSFTYFDIYSTSHFIL